MKWIGGVVEFRSESYILLYRHLCRAEFSNGRQTATAQNWRICQAGSFVPSRVEHWNEWWTDRREREEEEEEEGGFALSPILLWHYTLLHWIATVILREGRKEGKKGVSTKFVTWRCHFRKTRFFVSPIENSTSMGELICFRDRRWLNILMCDFFPHSVWKKELKQTSSF